MKVVLLKNVPKLGQAGDIKEVSPNYARNVLLKSKQAAIATPDKLKQLESQKAKLEKARAQTEAMLAKLSEKLQNASLTIKEKTNEQGKLFAGVSRDKISQAIKEQLGLEIMPQDIILNEPIKETGEHQVKYKLDNNLQGEFTLQVK